ncbi:type ISP restriction/modification enzyme [Bartonella sp. B35(2025)]
MIGFVTNASFIDAKSMDGLRACLKEDFTSLYIFHLRGDCNTSGERRRKEGGGIFKDSSRMPIAIFILVKNPEAQEKGKIYFKDIGDYLTTEEKLDKIKKLGNIKAIADWERIIPNEFNDWINQRDTDFNSYIALGEKRDKSSVTIFENYSQGVMTNRDSWCYNFSRKKLRENMKLMIDFYSSELERIQRNKISVNNENTFNNVVSRDPTKISWDGRLKKSFVKGICHQYEPKERRSVYRPFIKKMLYFDKNLNWSHYQIPKVFPEESCENRAIVVIGLGAKQKFSTLIVDGVPDYSFISSGQCFPLYLYEPIDSSGQLSLGAKNGEQYRRRDAITDKGLAHFQEAYPGEKIRKEDLFYYIYGLLHSDEYRERYAKNLNKQIPRIPRVKSFADFSAFAQARS